MLRTKDIILYYPMEGNANDASGLNNNGTVTGATLTTGKSGQCYSFIASNSNYIESATNNLLNTTTFTLSFWIKMATINRRNQIFSAGELQTSKGVWFQVETNNKLRFDASSSAGIDGNTTLSANTWYHVAVTSDANIITYYVNGVKDCTPFNKNFTITGGTQRIGSGIAGYVAYFNGLIDDVSIFSEVLSVENIKRVMLGLHPIC